MQPSIADTLQCVLENLEEIAFPQLQEEHAQSVARCTSILLRVVLLRLEHEPAMLAADSREKRALLRALVTELHSAALGVFGTMLPQVQSASTEPALPLVTLDALSQENVRLKALLESVIESLHAQRPTLGEARFVALQSRVRTQLRAQIDRELDLVKTPFGGPGFPY